MNRVGSESIAQSMCKNLVISLWRDDRGFVVSMELILIVTILVIGTIAGLTALRDAVVEELSDVARSVQEVNQSYQLNAAQGHSADSAGAGYADHSDGFQSPGGVNHCIAVFGTADEP